MNELNEQTLWELDEVQLLHRVVEIVSQFDELDPQEAGDALGALVQEFAERRSPETVLAQFRRLLLERDPDADLESQLGAIREGMAHRAALRRDVAALTSERVQGGCAGHDE